ncbi:hypothetical protein BKA56DRAFT_611126 [Ilyonectria sp. MPI-CAGE-AT-0026]|nr:hypothetical protein BKA56DRAFT_611126 [Ilyonectria sp. MPI-CAGE-AT-0026]
MPLRSALAKQILSGAEVAAKLAERNGPRYPPQLHILVAANSDKCDKDRPSCGRCARTEQPCMYVRVPLQFRDASSWAAEKVDRAQRDQRKPGSNLGKAAVARRTTSSSISTSTSEASLDFQFQGSPSWPSPSLPTPSAPHSREDVYVYLEQTDCGTFEPPLASLPLTLSSEPDLSSYRRETSLIPGANTDGGWQCESTREDAVALFSHAGSTWRDTDMDIAAFYSPIDGLSPELLPWIPALEKLSSMLDGQSDSFSLDSPQPDCTRVATVSVPAPSLSNLCILVSSKLIMYHMVLQVLPPHLNFRQNAAISPEVVLNAAMSLGAANMANLKGTYTCRRWGTKKTVWSTDRSHKVEALRYAGKALSLAAKSTSQGIGSLVTAHLILMYVEVELGTFEGLRRYLASIKDLVVSEQHRLDSCESGQELIRGVEHSRAVLRFVAGPWTLPELDATNLWVRPGCGLSSSAGLVHRLGNCALFVGCRIFTFQGLQFLRDRPSATMRFLVGHGLQFLFQGDPADLKLDSPELDPAVGMDEALQELGVLAGRLGRCEPLAGIPLVHEQCMPSNKVTSSRDELIASITPLHFKNHEQAMEAADYAFAQMLCDVSYLVQYLSPSPTTESTNPWLLILLRIAAGINPSDCAYRNRYRRGIAAMLLNGALRCGDLSALLFLETFIDRLIATFSEGWNVMASNDHDFVAMFGREADGTLCEEFLELPCEI